jgi:hypothetical protein
MTSLEMNIEFLRLLRAINKELALSEIPDTETILQMLTISQIRYLKEVYLKDGEHSNILNKSDELRDLIRRELVACTVIDTGPLTNIAYSVDLSTLDNDFMFYIRSDSKLTRTAMPVIDTIGGAWMPNEYIKYADKDKFLTTPIHIPIIIKPGCFIENTGSANSLIIICDDYTELEETIGVDAGISLEYIKEPADITLEVGGDSELPNFMHEEIVKFAVDIYINNYKLRLMSKPNTDK